MIQVLNKKTPSKVDAIYEGRTFLTGSATRNCSLRVINLTPKDEGDYFPGINSDINSNVLQSRIVKVSVSKKLPRPSIISPKVLEEKRTVNITCSVNHTCTSKLPTLAWNMTGHQTTQEHKYDETLQEWIIVSIMTYTPFYRDDGRMLECVATFPNNRKSKNYERLRIKYSPKEITISVKSIEGDHVTLGCSSQANPPAIVYSWYQIHENEKLLKGEGETITVKNMTTDQYICSAANEMGTGESPVFQFDESIGSTRRTVLGIAVGLVAVVLIVILFVFYRKKICHRPPSPEQPLDITYADLQQPGNVDDYDIIQPKFPKECEGNAASTEYMNVTKKASR